MNILPYDRQDALQYCKKYAFQRNPNYLDFTGIGGDCTNFTSQCLYAGCGVMNYTPVKGWYYKTSTNRTASWTGVHQFYNFLVNNKEQGPFGKEVSPEELELGDIIQLGNNTGRFYHALLVTAIEGHRDFHNIYVAAHSDDAYHRKLSTYTFHAYRCLHIEGARKN